MSSASGSRLRLSGLTLVELLVAMALGLGLGLAASALLMAGRQGYAEQEEVIRLEQSGRHAIEIVARAIRGAAYENWDSAKAALLATPDVSAAIAGLDAASLGNADGMEAPQSGSVNGSDVLALRFIGSTDGAMLDCAGFVVAEPASPERIEQDRGWSIFHVARDDAGEPELRCKYRGGGKWRSDALVRGVESFQVLYGLDTDADGLANQFLSASAINRLDQALAVSGADANAQALDRNRKTHWKKVVSVKLALLLCGSRPLGATTAGGRFDLFGADYARLQGAVDPGSSISVQALPAASRGRQRKLFSTTVQLRNHAAGSGA
jgi:type IV pilus assembly protein PilW